MIYQRHVYRHSQPVYIWIKTKCCEYAVQRAFYLVAVRQRIEVRGHLLLLPARYEYAAAEGRKQSEHILALWQTVVLQLPFVFTHSGAAATRQHQSIEHVSHAGRHHNGGTFFPSCFVPYAKARKSQTREYLRARPTAPRQQ